MATLIVLRHAKAVDGLGLADIERPLNDRGRRDAKAAGRHLRDDGLVPELVLCSTATRTRETLARLRLGDESEVSYEPRIYDNDVDALFELVQGVDDTVATLLLIGHSPSVHQFVIDVTGADIDRYPTSACAAVSFDQPWTDLALDSGALISLWTPKTA
jgi:phosphohistidine phosphatase